MKLRQYEEWYFIWQDKKQSARCIKPLGIGNKENKRRRGRAQCERKINLESEAHRAKGIKILEKQTVNWWVVSKRIVIR